MGKGKIVGSWFMKGEPPKGTASAEYSEVQRAAAEEAQEAMSKQKVPSEYRDYVREYFDSIRVGDK
jgi:hypothetical protein